MRIFVSYTTWSKEINKESLLKVEKILDEYGEVYIELLDSNSDKSQKKVLTELENSDILLLIKTDESYKSKWVKLELEYALANNIPIVVYEYNSILNEKVDLKIEQDLKFRLIS